MSRSNCYRSSTEDLLRDSSRLVYQPAFMLLSLRKSRGRTYEEDLSVFLTASVFVSLLCSKLNVHASANAVQASIMVTVKIASYPNDATTSSGALSGHSFLAVYNDSTISVTIGHMLVAPGDYITVGSFDNRSANHGVWQNENFEPGSDEQT